MVNAAHLAVDKNFKRYDAKDTEQFLYHVKIHFDALFTLKCIKQCYYQTLNC